MRCRWRWWRCRRLLLAYLIIIPSSLILIAIIAFPFITISCNNHFWELIIADNNFNAICITFVAGELLSQMGTRTLLTCDARQCADKIKVSGVSRCLRVSLVQLKWWPLLSWGRRRWRRYILPLTRRSTIDTFRWWVFVLQRQRLLLFFLLGSRCFRWRTCLLCNFHREFLLHLSYSFILFPHNLP